MMIASTINLAILALSDSAKIGFVALGLFIVGFVVDLVTTGLDPKRSSDIAEKLIVAAAIVLIFSVLAAVGGGVGPGLPQDPNP